VLPERKSITVTPGPTPQLLAGAGGGGFLHSSCKGL
jgi:hypothetical protein